LDLDLKVKERKKPIDALNAEDYASLKIYPDPVKNSNLEIMTGLYSKT